MTLKIITDSTADLDANYLSAHDITVLGMTVMIGEKAYETIGKHPLDNATLISEMRKGKVVQTSQINLGEFSEVFESFARKGTQVLYLAFSSGLSGTYQTALIAQKMVLEKNPDADITVIDTLAAASGEGLLVEEVVKLRDAGKSLNEILTILSDMIPRLSSQFMVDDLNHLARGGRIPKAVALVGTMANIKPLLDVDAQGKLRQLSKVRGKKKAVNALIEKTLENMDSKYPRLIIAYAGSSYQTAVDIKQNLLQNNRINEIDIRPLGPTIVTHSGDGTLAVFSIANKKRQ